MDITHVRARTLTVGDQIINLSGTRFTKPMIVTEVTPINGEKVQISFVMDGVAGVRTINKRAHVEVVTGFVSQEVSV